MTHEHGRRVALGAWSRRARVVRASRYHHLVTTHGHGRATPYRCEYR